MPNRNFSTFIIVIFGVAFVSLSGIFIRMTQAPVFAVAFYRMVASTLMLTPFALMGIRRRISSRAILLTVLSGAVLGVHFAAFIASVKSTSIVHATVLVTLHPVIVVSAEALLRRRRPPVGVVIAVAASLVGAIVLASGSSSGGVPVTLRGNTLAIIGAVTVSIYMLLGRQVRGEVPAGLYNALVYGVAALVLVLPTALLGQLSGPFARRDIFLVIALAFFCTLLGHSVFNWALRYVSASLVSTTILLEPLFAGVIAVFAFSEYPGPVSLLGAVLVFGGVWAVARLEMPAQDTADTKKGAGG